MSQRRFLGVFVNPMDVQSEGISPVLDALEDVGVTAIATTPLLAVLDSNGHRIPELHIDGHARLLARPIWGKREFSCRMVRAFDTDASLYSETPYRPGSGPVPADLDRDIPFRLVEEAQKRGLAAYIQVTPFVPPAVRMEDQPVYIDGSRPQPPQVAMSACPNSPAARNYAHALVAETVAHFPTIDGLFMDWVEFGAYRLEDNFTCFCPACQRAAEAAGEDWEDLKQGVMAAWKALHGLSADQLRSAEARSLGGHGVEVLARDWPALLRLSGLKSRAVTSFYQEARQRLDAAGRSNVRIAARGWAPPWNVSSGLDYSALSSICDELTPKLFTFDFSALPRWYGETLKRWNPELGEGELLSAILACLDLPDGIGNREFAHYTIPAPDDPHPASLESHARRVAQMIGQASRKTAVRPFAHAYLPEPQWGPMVAMIRDSAADGMWVQMYGYLSDAKLKILKDTWSKPG